MKKQKNLIFPPSEVDAEENYDRCESSEDDFQEDHVSLL